jgi:hypothetical protein
LAQLLHQGLHSRESMARSFIASRTMQSFKKGEKAWQEASLAQINYAAIQRQV